VSALKKYSPWIITLLAVLALFLTKGTGPQGSSTIRTKIVVQRDTLRDTVTITGQGSLRVIYRTAQAAADSSSIAQSIQDRDSISADLSRSIITVRDIDTCVTIPIKDSSRITLRVTGFWELETGRYELGFSIEDIQIYAECPSTGDIWRWVERAVTAAIIIIKLFVK
jgi:hypothetical protein